MKVMIAVDKSAHADFALRYYLKHLHRDGNHVILIHNATIESMAAMGVELLGQVSKQPQIWEDMLTQADNQIKIVRAHYDDLMKVSGIKDYNVHIVHGGDVGESVVKRAKEENVELVIVGTRGQGTLRRTILGSVSDYVLHHAKCPVTVCHRPEND